MANNEEIGVLRIDLTLDNADFTKSVQQIDTKLRGLNSEFKAASGGNKEYEKTLQGLKDKQENLSKTLDLQKIKVSTLKAEYEKISEAQGSNSVEAEKMLTKYNNAVATLKKTETQLDKTTRAIKEQENPWKQAKTSAEQYSESLEDASEKISKFGDNSKNIGSSLSVGITAPLVGLGVAAGSAAAQFDNAAGQIQAALGVTADEAEALEDKATSVWKDGFGESLEEVSNGLIRVKQNMKEIDGSEIEGVTKNALALAKTFDSDVNEVTRAANNLMVNFGITSGEALDLLAYGAQNGLNFSNELFDNVAEYSGLFSTLGFESEEYFNALIKGSQEGIYNLDYLNDVVKEFGIRIKDGSESTTDAIAYLFADDGIDNFIGSLKTAGSSSEAYQELMAKVGKETADLWTSDLKKTGKASEDAATFIQMTMGSYDEFMQGMADGSIKGSDAMQMILEKIQALEDPTLRAQLGVSLFGTKWEDLEETAMFSLTNIGGEIENLEGSMKSVSDAQDKTFGQRWNEAIRTAQTSLLPLGETLLDVAEEWLPKISAGIEEATDWFSELSPTAKNTTLAIGALAAVLPPIITGIGFMASGISGLISIGTPLIGLLTGAGAAAGTAGASAGILGTALTVLTGPVGLTIATLAALGVGVYAVSKELGESSIQVEDWKDKVSNATAESVGNFMELQEEATLSLNQLAWSGAEVTTEMANNMVSIYDQMGEQVLTAMQENHTAQLELMTNHFATSAALTEEEETAILTKMQEKQTERETAITEGNARIAEIMNTASVEKRAITQSEQQEINQIQQTMTSNAIEYLTENEREQKVILESLKNEASKITAEQAAEVVQNSVKQKDEVVKEAKSQYEKTVAEIVKQRDEMGTISAEQAQKLIDEAKKQRDGTIKNAEEMHSKVVAEAKSQAKEHVNQVDWETGEVLSKWEVFKDNVGKKWSALVSDGKKWFGDLYDETTGKVDDARDSISKTVDEITGFFKNLKLKLPEIQLPKLPKIELDFSTKNIFGKELSYPSGFNIKYFAEGGIMKQPTIFGAMGNTLAVGGEAGNEMALPLNAKTVFGYLGKPLGEYLADNLLNKVQFPSTIIVQSVLDGKIIAESTSLIQHSNVNLTALTRGVSLT